MSKYNDSLIIKKPLDESIKLCKKAISNLKWRVLEKSSMKIVIKDEAKHITSFTNSVKIELLFNHITEGTEIIINGSIFGFGPQSEHLKGQVGRFINEIETLI